jgi:hypothetical protein
MAYKVVIKRSDANRADTADAAGLGEAKNLAKRAIRGGVCERVDIYDPAVSRDKPIVAHEDILKEIEAEGGR